MPSSDQIVWASMPEALPEPRLDGQRQRRMHAAAERRQDHEPPVAELVAEPLDDEAPVRRQRAGDLALLVEVGDEVRRGQLVEVVLLAEPRRERAHGPSRRAPARPRPRAGSSPIARPSSTGRPTESPFQNGSLPGHARRRLDDHPIRRDVEDPPASSRRGRPRRRASRRGARRPSPRRARRRAGPASPPRRRGRRRTARDPGSCRRR